MASGNSVEEGTELTVKIEAKNADTVKLLLCNGSFTGYSAMAEAVTMKMTATEYLSFTLKTYAPDTASYPSSAVLNTNEPDQNILYNNGVYYRTAWTKISNCWSIAYTGDLSKWSQTENWDYCTVVDLSAVFGDLFVSGTGWAPDLIEVGGKYYLVGNVRLTDYDNTSGYYDDSYMAIVIFEADTPIGPYKLISKQNTAQNKTTGFWIWKEDAQGQVTPVYGTKLGGITTAGWNAIDGTIFVDGNDVYLLWSDEWTNYSDYTGRYYYAKLSDDLSELTEKPKPLFTPASWVSAHKTTDAVWLHKAENGDLLALYSSYESDGSYCVHYARSSNGEIDGTWSYVGVLYSTLSDSTSIVDPYIENSGNVEAGHASLFCASNGQLYLALHLHQSDYQPNGRLPAIIAIEEKVVDGKTTLVWSE